MARQWAKRSSSLEAREVERGARGQEAKGGLGEARRPSRASIASRLALSACRWSTSVAA